MGAPQQGARCPKVSVVFACDIFFSPVQRPYPLAPWRNGGASDSKSEGCGFNPHRGHAGVRERTSMSSYLPDRDTRKCYRMESAPGTGASALPRQNIWAKAKTQQGHFCTSEVAHSLWIFGVQPTLPNRQCSSEENQNSICTTCKKHSPSQSPGSPWVRVSTKGGRQFKKSDGWKHARKLTQVNYGNMSSSARRFFLSYD